MTDRPNRWSARLANAWPYLISVLLLTLATAVLLRPVVAACGSTIMGAPGDATNGGVWTAYNYLTTNGPPWLETTPYTAAPGGETWWRPYYVTASLVFGPIWLTTNLSGSAVCGWNLSIAAGFVASGLAMFALVWRLFGSARVAHLAALAYMIVPYRQLKAEGHVAYVHTYLFPLLLLTALLLWQRPTKPRIVAAASVVALLGYSDGYFILLGGVAFIAAHGAALAWVTLVDRAPWQHVRPRVAAVVATGALSALLLVPVLVTFLTTNSEISGNLTRSASDVERYSARPSEYLLPTRSHPVFDDSLGPWQDANLHGSNYSESTLFVGWTVLVGAAFAALAFFRGRDHKDKAARDDRFAVAVLGVVAVVTFLFSLPPRWSVLGIDVPMPSGVISSVVAFWRVYARFFIVVHAALVGMAAWSARELFRRTTSRAATAAATVVLLALILFESLVTITPGSWSYRLAPQVYRFVAEQEDVDIIAEWPMYPTSAEPDHLYLTYLPVHRKRLVNVLENQSPADQLARGIYGLNDPQTAGVLRRLGADLVIYHYSEIAAGDPPDPAQYEKVASFSYETDLRVNPALRKRADRWRYLTPAYDADVYRVRPGPAAEVGVAVGRGFYDPSLSTNGMSSRWLEEEGQLHLVALAGRPAQATVSMALESLERTPRTVEVRQQGKVLWSGKVTGPQSVSFAADVGEPLDFVAKPGPGSYPGDPRALSINVSQLSAVRLSGPGDGDTAR